MKKIFIFIFLLCTIDSYSNNWSLIDVDKNDIYINPGKISSIQGKPLNKKDISSNSSYPNLPKHNFFSLFTSEYLTYTYIIPFSYTQIKDNKLYSLFIDKVSSSLKIFINDEIIYKTSFDTNAQIYTKRNTLINIPSNVLKEGSNVLKITVRGNPYKKNFGLKNTKKIVISDISKSFLIKTNISNLISIAILLFITIYHFTLYLFRSQEKYNILFSFFTFSVFIFMFIDSSIFSNHYEGQLLDIIQSSIMIISFSFLLIFLDFIQYKKLTKASKHFTIYSLLLIIAIAVTYNSISDSIIYIWKLSLLIPIINYILKNYRNLKKKYTVKKKESSHLSIFSFISSKGNLSNTGKIGIATLLLILAYILDFLEITTNSFILYISAIILFIIITTFILSHNFILVNRTVEELNISLQGKVKDLNNSKNQLTLSEQKYRYIIESANHYVLTISSKGEIKTANYKFIKDFKLNKDSLSEVSITDILYKDPEEFISMVQILEEKITECLMEENSVALSLKFKSKISNEPKKVNVKMEHIHFDDNPEIILRAYDVSSDILVQYLSSEKLKYIITNYFTLAEEITHRLIRNTGKYISQSTTKYLRIALREILINAIEHGNLDISFTEKTDIIRNSDYLDFLSKRRQEEKYKDKKVTIDYSLNHKQITFNIRDEGNGFDHILIRKKAVEMANDNFLSHGRGISMAEEIFDQIKYNEKGNEVQLILNIPEQS